MGKADILNLHSDMSFGDISSSVTALVFVWESPELLITHCLFGGIPIEINKKWTVKMNGICR